VPAHASQPSACPDRPLPIIAHCNKSRVAEAGGLRRKGTGDGVTDSPVTVIIAAYGAADTIGDAVRSTLAQPPVGEVIVVDDASRDGTAAAAQAADDGSGRLVVLRQQVNAGPSAARNRAVAAARQPLLAILDADDQILPGRFEPLLARDGWDFIADNIAFVQEGEGRRAALDALPRGDAARPLRLTEFAHRNISRAGRRRGELGFLKPLFRRDFLLNHGLRYAEHVRLGEDFLLYAEAMIQGARFWIAERCGYLAVERSGSLSGRHATADLHALELGSRALAGRLQPGTPEAAAMAQHARSVQIKRRHREVLDDKAGVGAGRALLRLARTPGDVVPVARAVLADKLARPSPPEPLRLLFDADDFPPQPSGPVR
jgi:succinoglycan biosynthesis protein ExoU